MEYVEGEHFLNYLRNGPAEESDGTTVCLGPSDPVRLRAALVQLARGIHALHGTNMIHRDIKSINVKVDRTGRVKLLDFGLVAEIDRTQARASGPVGTIDHMSPEQLGTQPLTSASDWYSFGVILYAALCGQVPFTGTVFEIMRQKETAPPRPSELVPGVPPDLEALCLELLHPNPAERPSGADEACRPGRHRSRCERCRVGNSSCLAATGTSRVCKWAAVAVRCFLRPVIVEAHGAVRWRKDRAGRAVPSEPPRHGRRGDPRGAVLRAEFGSLQGALDGLIDAAVPPPAAVEPGTGRGRAAHSPGRSGPTVPGPRPVGSGR